MDLKWRQVDLPRQLILLEHTKNGDRLSVPMCRMVVDVFRTLGKVRHLHPDTVFSGPDGRVPSEFLVSMTFVRVCRRVGVLDFRFHDLRHTFASTLVQRGVDLYRVQRLLDHRDGRMTQRYAHLSPDNLREAIRVLDTVITFSAQSGGEERGGVS